MEKKFTKGIWHTNSGQIYPESTGATLAMIPYWDENNKEKQANAKLIATAPELLDALECMIKHASVIIDGNHPDMRKAYEVIYKALE